MKQYLGAHRLQNSQAHIPTIFFERTPEDPLEPDFEKDSSSTRLLFDREPFEPTLLEDSCLIKAPMPPMALAKTWI
jgi:hypothetical protein